MNPKECIAMILAGGQGSRLGVLTKNVAKPAVAFGGKYRIIDFSLSNCYHSGIDTVGVLTQYKPLELHSYIGIGSSWDLDRNNGGVFILPPYANEAGGKWYKGTADAIFQNMNFINRWKPEFVLILSGDHIYKMDYFKMLNYHKERKADATIAVFEVPLSEASRFGMMNTKEDGQIVEFEEKPKQPKSNLASMGVYIFNWPVLRQYLYKDAQEHTSQHDFGKNIIPSMLQAGQKLVAYRFRGYWKDVGTVESFYQANMDLLADHPDLNLYDPDWRIFSVNASRPPEYIGNSGKVGKSLIGEGCMVYGEVYHSVLFPDVYISEGTTVKNSVVMTGAHIGSNAAVENAIIGRKVTVKDGAVIGTIEKKELTVIPEETIVNAKSKNSSPNGIEKQVV